MPAPLPSPRLQPPAHPPPSTAPPDLTTSAKCFDDVQVSFGDGGTDEFGALDGTGPLEALRSTVSAPFDAQVHRGFARRAMKYSRWVQAELRKEDAFPPEDATAPWNHGGIASLKDLYVTGHSLGGAASLAFAYWVKVWPQPLELCSPSPLTSNPTLPLAQVAFKELNPDLVVHVYVFSAPNVGNAAWAQHYDELLGDTTFQHSDALGANPTPTNPTLTNPTPTPTPTPNHLTTLNPNPNPNP